MCMHSPAHEADMAVHCGHLVPMNTEYDLIIMEDTAMKTRTAIGRKPKMHDEEAFELDNALNEEEPNDPREQ